MPIHDWTRVDAGIFHHFHQAWGMAISIALNDGILPSEYYALAEQVVGRVEPEADEVLGRLGPDVVALQRPPLPANFTPTRGGVMTLEAAPPRTKYHLRTEEETYAKKANRVVIRHRSDHRVIALIEVVSPGNKDSTDGLQSFLRKANEVLEGGVHLLIIDLFPAGPRDPEGLHPLIREDLSQPVDPDGEPFRFDPDKPLLLMSYVAAPGSRAFVEPVAVGDELPPMPLFLTNKEYVPVPLSSTYETAWRALPAFWREVLTPPRPE